MAFIIDALYVFRELGKLLFFVLTSPFAVIASLLMLGSYQP